MANTFNIFKREFRAYLVSPVVYIFIVFYLLLTGIFTFKVSGFYELGQANLKPFFSWHIWLYLFLMPALSMRLWSEEYRGNTVEMLFTYPVRIHEAVIGKFLAAWAVSIIAALLTFPMPLTVFYLGEPDIGPIITGYLGAILLAGGYLAIGSFFSSLTRNQAVAFILSFAATLSIIFVGFEPFVRFFDDLNIPFWLLSHIGNFSFITRFASLQKGVIDIRDVFFFISVIAASLYCCVLAIEGRTRRLDRPLISIIVMIFILSNIAVSSILGDVKLDLTKERLYTLSPATRSVLAKIDGTITFKLFYSKTEAVSLGNMKGYAERVGDLLKAYSKASGGRVTVEFFDPIPDTDTQEWAKRYGIEPMRLSSGSTIYFGLVGTNERGSEEVIPVINPAREELLEYDLTRLVYNLSKTKKEVIGVISSLPVMGRAAAPSGTPLPRLPQWTFIKELSDSYTMRELENNTGEIPKDVNLLMVIHPKGLAEKTVYAIDQYIVGGGRAIIYIDPYCEADIPSDGTNRPDYDRSSSMKRLLAAWGVEMAEGKVVSDINSATSVNFGGASMPYIVWQGLTRKNLSRQDIVTMRLDNMLLASAGALTYKAVSGIDYQPMLFSNKSASLINAAILGITPPQEVLNQYVKGDHEITMALRLNGRFSSAFKANPQTVSEERFIKEGTTTTSVIIVSDADILSDKFSQDTQDMLGRKIAVPMNDNLNFTYNAVEYLSGSNSLFNIRTRGTIVRPFIKVKEIEQAAALRWNAEEERLARQVDEMNRRLSDMPDIASAGKGFGVNGALRDEIARYRSERTVAQKRLREVRRNLRQDKAALGNLLFGLNAFLVPLIATICGFIIYTARRRASK